MSSGEPKLAPNLAACAVLLDLGEMAASNRDDGTRRRRTQVSSRSQPLKPRSRLHGSRSKVERFTRFHPGCDG